MNPDTDPNTTSDAGSDARIEEWLRAVPPPELPPDWRAAILKSATPPVWPWFTRPVRWGLAASWAAIAAFHFTTPSAPAPPASGNFASPPPAPMVVPDDWLANLNGADFNPDSALP